MSFLSKHADLGFDSGCSKIVTLIKWKIGARKSASVYRWRNAEVTGSESKAENSDDVDQKHLSRKSPRCIVGRVAQG